MAAILKTAALFLCLLALTSCVGKASEAESWRVTPLGKAYFFYWCDNQHVVLDTEITEYVNVENPKERTPIALKDGRAIYVVGCNADGILAETYEPPREESLAGGPGSLELYAFPSQGSPRRLARFKDHLLHRPSQPVHGPAKLIVSSLPRKPVPNGYVTDKDCAMHVDPEYRVICLDVTFEQVTALEASVIVHYQWSGYETARSLQGKLVQVLYIPEISKSPDGRQMGQGWYRHDLNGRVVQRLSPDPDFRVNDLASTVSPDGRYLYAPCKRADKSRYSDDYDKVCRANVIEDGRNWEEVFSVNLEKMRRNGIREVSVDNKGNIYFPFGGRGTSNGIWMFVRNTAEVRQIVQGAKNAFDSHPVVSPDGNKLVFLRNQILHVAQPSATVK